MEYQPRYSQPFTLEEARQLAVPMIAEEISRLQRSLVHLRRTQDELKEALSIEPNDTDLTEALKENDVVIASQTERISMLRIVLAEKGIPFNDGAPGSQPNAAAAQTPRRVQNAHRNANERSTIVQNETEPANNVDEGGVYL